MAFSAGKKIFLLCNSDCFWWWLNSICCRFLYTEENVHCHTTNVEFCYHSPKLQCYNLWVESYCFSLVFSRWVMICIPVREKLYKSHNQQEIKRGKRWMKGESNIQIYELNSAIYIMSLPLCFIIALFIFLFSG